MRTFEEYRQKFHGLYRAMKATHAASQKPHRGHGLDHDVTVGMLGVRIAPGERTGELAFCGGLLHSLDRIVEKSIVPDLITAHLEELPDGYFTSDELDDIWRSVMRHEEPRDDDSVLQQVLMDADRLANIMLSGALRAAQFYAELPVVEFNYLSGRRNPATTWNEPTSALDGVRIVYEMLHPMRTEKGKELARRFAAQLAVFVAGTEEQYADLGLVGIRL
jgi:hypothetical protein